MSSSFVLQLPLAAFTVMAISATACTGSGGDFSVDDIPATTPAGKIEGKPWQMAAVLVRQDGAELDVSLSATANTADCPFLLGGDTPGVLFNVPAAVGQRQLQFGSLANSQTITMFVPPAQNYIATEGIISITALSATEVTLGFVADAGDSAVSGTFTTKVCPKSSF